MTFNSNRLLGLFLAFCVIILGIVIKEITPMNVHYPLGFIMGGLTILTITIFEWLDDKSKH